jgi:hypothetical protein
MSFAALGPRRSHGARVSRALVPRWRSALLVAVSASVCALLVGLNVRPAFAIQAKPATDWSFYMKTTSTSTAYNLGCNQGHFDAGHGNINSEVVLDFGGQNSAGTGTLMINGVSISNGQIEAVAEQFSYGYWICTGSDTTSVLKVGLGTNNSYYDVSSSGGHTWANVVAAVRSYNHSHGYDTQVNAGGANDIEPSWNSWSATKAWIDGYAAVDPAYYLNYGSVDGCPSGSASNGGCNNGWNQYDVWYASWGSPPAFPTPEIYYGVNAQQWAMISLYGALHQSGRVYMQGPWDEYDLDTSTLTPTGAWNDLWTDLNNNSNTTQNMPFSLEIHSET